MGVVASTPLYWLKVIIMIVGEGSRCRIILLVSVVPPYSKTFYMATNGYISEIRLPRARTLSSGCNNDTGYVHVTNEALLNVYPYNVISLALRSPSAHEGFVCIAVVSFKLY